MDQRKLVENKGGRKMKKTISIKVFKEIAGKHKEGEEILSRLFECGHTRVKVAGHTFCRLEKNGEGIINLHICSKKGYYDNLEEKINENPLIKELVDNCEK